MTRILPLILAGFAVGCLPPRPAGPRPDPPDPNRPEVTVRVDPQRVTFADPAMQTAFRELDAAARRLAGPDWLVRNAGTYVSEDPDDRARNRGSYVGWWSLGPVPEGGHDPYPPPKHRVRITVSVGGAGNGTGFWAEAERAAVDGWGARVSASRLLDPLGVRDGFGFTLEHPVHLPDPSRRRGVVRFGGRSQEVHVFRSDGRFYYALTASSDSPLDPAERRPPGENLRMYWRSAESFRDAALADLDRLAANLGDPARRRFRTSPFDPRRKADVQEAERKAPPDPTRAALLDEARAEVAARKKLVRDHHREMHAALQAAFPPLADALAPGRDR